MNTASPASPITMPLLAGDIILVQHKRGFMRWILRRILHSHWDHAALVVYPKDESVGRHQTVFVEALKRRSLFDTQRNGVVVHSLERYLNDPARFDVGIKRVIGLTDDERARVMTYMLMNVDAPYWPWESLIAILAAFSERVRRWYLDRQRFSCSSLIQKCFYETLDWDRKRIAVFKEGLWSPIELQELVSPAEIAESRCTEWIHNPR